MPKYTAEYNGQRYEIEAPDEQAAAEAIANMQPGSGQAVYGGTDTPVTKGQERALSGMGGLDPMMPVGTARNPRFETPDSGAAPLGTYIDREGKTVEPQQESWQKTLFGGLNRVANPMARLGYGPQSERLDAAESGLSSGLLLGGKNELTAGLNSLPALMPGGEGYREAFRGNLSELDRRDEVLRETYPGAYYGGGATGTVASAVASPAATGVKGILGNAAIGGAAGYLSTDGTNEDRIRNGVIGGILGGVAAGAGNVALREAPVSQLSPTRIPADIPAGDANRALSYVRKQTSMAPEELAAAPVGSPLTAAEVMGKRAQTGLAALARREGKTADALEGQLVARQTDRPQRLMDAFTEHTGVLPEEAMGNIEALVEKGRANVDPLFKAARADPRPVMTQRLSAIADTPGGGKALRQAAADILNDVDSPGPQALGIEVTGMTPDGLPETVTLKAPTLETWDKVYKSLGAQVERNPITGRVVPDSVSPGNANINKLRAALRKELEEVSPEWGHAMSGSVDYKSAESAFADAQKMLFSNKTTAREFSARVARMSKGEQGAAKAGIANAILNLQQTARLKPGVLSTPIVKGKLEAIFGKEGAEALTKLAKDEQAMLNFERRAMPDNGSNTANLLEAMREQDDNPLLSGLIDAGGDLVTKGPSGAVGSQAVKLTQRVMARIKTRGMPIKARDFAGDILSLPPADAARLLANRPIKGRGSKIVGKALQHSGRSLGILSGRVN